VSGQRTEGDPRFNVASSILTGWVEKDRMKSLPRLGNDLKWNHFSTFSLFFSNFFPSILRGKKDVYRQGKKNLFTFKGLLKF
jgi:hypothetical protein